MIIVSPNVFKNAVNQLKGKIMKKAKLTRAICLMFALLTVISILSISAFATEPSNTYNFSFSTAGYTRYSSAVSKSSASSCYVYYSSGNAPYFVAAAGGTNANGNSHIDCSGGYYYRCTVGQRRYMYNYVYEQGYSYMQIRATYAGATSAFIYWSPTRWSLSSNVLHESNYMQ